MELFFTDRKFQIGGHPFPGVPFFVNDEYKLIDEINDFFTNDLLVDGRINSTKTWKSYAYWLSDFLQWADCNGVSWRKARKQELVAYRNWSLEECGLAPETVNSRLSVLKRFYAYAVRSGLAETNPIEEVGSKALAHPDSDFLSQTHKMSLKRNDLSVKVSHQLPQIFSDDEIKRLFQAVKSERLRLMMRLMLECGLRRAEVANLPASAVEDAIQSAQQKGPGSEIELHLPAYICKGRKARTVILSYPTAMKLMQYRATMRPKLVKKYKAKHNTSPEPFWLTQLGTAYKTESLTIEVERLGQKARVKDAYPHRFRHTFATTLYSVTGDLRLVQKLLGHSHIQTTTVYEHTAAVDHMGFFADYQREIDAMISRESV